MGERGRQGINAPLRSADQDQKLDTGVLLHVFEQFTKILKEYPF